MCPNWHVPAAVTSEAGRKISFRSRPTNGSLLGAPRLVSDRADDPDLETEVAQCAAHVALDVHPLALDELAAGQQHPCCTGLNRPTCIICAIPRASLRSDLLICWA